MAIGTPVNLGIASGSGVNTSSGKSITLVASVAVGAAVFVLVGDNAAASFNWMDTCSDSQGNTYTQVTTTTDNSADNLTLFACWSVTTALTSGVDTILVQSTSGITMSVAVSALSVTGLEPDSGALEGVTAATPSFGTAISVSRTNTNTNDLVLGCIVSEDTNAHTYTQASGYATPFTKTGVTATPTTGLFIAGGFKIVSANASQTFAPSLGTAATWGGFIVILKAATAGGSVNSGFFAFF